MTTPTADNLIIARARTIAGFGNLVQKHERLERDLRAAITKRDAHAAVKQYEYLLPNDEAKIVTLTEEVAASAATIKAKLEAHDSNMLAKVAQGSSEMLQKAEALIADLMQRQDVGADYHSMVECILPDLWDTLFTVGGQVYRKVEGTQAVEKVPTEIATEEISRRLREMNMARIVGTAQEILRTSSDESVRMMVSPILRNWAAILRDTTENVRYVRTDETARFREDVIPCLIDGSLHMLDRRTGKWDVPMGPDDVVLYPAVNATSTGESRSLDLLVAHHFRTPEEVEAFYRTCGISLFGYGIPNLVFLLGAGGSGKDTLFNMMRAAMGESLSVSINSAALTGEDENGDLARLINARFAYCSMESAHSRDGSFSTATLKTLTSGGQNPITVRAKYARAAVNVTYRGSLWLFGNKAPNLAGSGDFDGLDRRLIIMPMQRPLDKKANPPSGFKSWEDAAIACAPVFAYRCLAAFVQWHESGAVGYSDSRLRIPDEWARLTEESLYAGSENGALRALFTHDPYHGLSVQAVMMIMSELHPRMLRSKLLDRLRDTMSKHYRFEDKGHMESVIRDGVEYLPVGVDPFKLAEMIDHERLVTIKVALNASGWDEQQARLTSEINRTMNKKYRQMIDGEWDNWGE